MNTVKQLSKMDNMGQYIFPLKEMAGALEKNDLYKYLQQLEKSYDKGTDEDVKQTLRIIFSLQKVDLFSLVLVIAREAKFIHNNGRKSIAEITLYTFRDWLDKKVTSHYGTVSNSTGLALINMVSCIKIPVYLDFHIA